MDKLPDVVVAIIASFSDVRPRITTLPLVCKRFKACVANPLSWTAINLSEVPSWAAGMHLSHTLQWICSNIAPQRITDSLKLVVQPLTAFSHAEGPFEFTPDFFTLLASFASLKRICFTIPAASVIEPRMAAFFVSTISRMSDLRDLSLTLFSSQVPTISYPTALLELPLQAMPNLQHLRLCVCKCLAWPHHNATLSIPSSLTTLDIHLPSHGMFKRIDFSNATSLTYIAMSTPRTTIDGLSGLSKLKRLNLKSYSPNIWDVLLPLTGLQVLELSGRRVDCPAFLQQLALIPNILINDIRLRQCSIDAVCIASLSQLPHVAVLEIDKCEVADSQAYASLANCTSLQSLKVFHSNCLDEHFFCGVRNAPKLTTLDLIAKNMVYQQQDMKDMRKLLGACINIRYLTFSDRVIFGDPDRTVQFDAQPCIVLGENQAEAVSQIGSLERLTTPMPESMAAFQSLSKLHNLKYLELRFDRWRDRFSTSWFSCLSSMRHLRTIVFTFRTGLCVAAPCHIGGVVPYLRCMRQLSRVHLRVQKHDWYKEYGNPVADDSAIARHEAAFWQAAAAFACLRGVQLAVCGRTFDLSDRSQMMALADRAGVCERKIWKEAHDQRKAMRQQEKGRKSDESMLGKRKRSDEA